MKGTIKPYYQKNNVTIYCGDHLKIMPQLDPIDLVVTSPPYGKLREYGGYTFDYKLVGKEILCLLVQGGIMVWVVGDETENGSESGESFRQALYFKKIGFRLHDTMIYKKRNPAPFHSNRYNPSFEYMFVLSKGKPKTVNLLRMQTQIRGRTAGGFRQSNGGIRPRHSSDVRCTKPLDNVWEFVVGHEKDAIDHPAVFPMQLASNHIRSWSSFGDVVLDPMCGSGTTLVVAKSLGRKVIGIDSNEKFCALTVKRLQKTLDPNRWGMKRRNT